MKQFAKLKYLMVAFIVAMLSLSFTACGDDDDDVMVTPETSSIVGSWKYSGSDDDTSLIITFRSNNTGVVTVTAYENGRESGSTSENFEYSYSSTNQTVTLVGSSLEGTYRVTVTASYLMLGNAKFSKM